MPNPIDYSRASRSELNNQLKTIHKSSGLQAVIKSLLTINEERFSPRQAYRSPSPTAANFSKSDSPYLRRLRVDQTSRNKRAAANSSAVFSAPKAAFRTEDGEKPSGLLTMLTPSLIPAECLLGLSVLHLVLMSESDVRKVTSSKAPANKTTQISTSINSTTKAFDELNQIRKYAQDFYHASFHYKFTLKFAGQARPLMIAAPTKPYFRKQLVILDPLRRNDYEALIEKTIKERPSTSKKADDTKGPSHQRYRLFPDEQRKVYQQVLTSAMSEASLNSFRPSTTDVTIIMGILSEMPVGTILAQNSPSALSDPNYTHIQCFSEEECPGIPVFSAIDKMGAISAGEIRRIKNYPGSSLVVNILDKNIEASTKKLMAFEKSFEKHMAGLEKSLRADIAYIARRTKTGIQLVYLLKKDLSYHKKLEAKTNTQVLAPATKDQPAIFNTRPAFFEMAGGRLLQHEDHAALWPDELITTMLTEYSASDQVCDYFTDLKL